MCQPSSIHFIDMPRQHQFPIPSDPQPTAVRVRTRVILTTNNRPNRKKKKTGKGERGKGKRGRGKRTYHIRKPLQLPASNALEHHAHAGGPVARAHRQPVHGAQNAHDAVAGHVEHGGGDDAVGFGEAYVGVCVRIVFCGDKAGRGRGAYSAGRRARPGCPGAPSPCPWGSWRGGARGSTWWWL